MNRAELSDLIATAPAEHRAELERASDFYDQRDFRRCAELLSIASDGLTSWHYRAQMVAFEIEAEDESLYPWEGFMSPDDGPPPCAD